MTLTDRSPQPRYAQLAGTLIRRIAVGLYPMGTFLPTEVELGDEFAVSRHTVREALCRLSEAGLLRRRQGSGIQVVAAQPQRSFVHAMRSLDGLFHYAVDTTFRIDRIGLACPAPDEAALLGSAGGVDWLIVAGLRIDPAVGTALCVSTVYIARAFAAIGAELRSRKGAIYLVIETRFGVKVADVEQAITAHPIPPAVASALGLSRKDWAVRVVRRYRDATGTLLLASVNDHPAERFSYTMHLRQ